MNHTKRIFGILFVKQVLIYQQLSILRDEYKSEPARI